MKSAMRLVLIFSAIFLAMPAMATQIVTVKVENLAAEDSVSFAPLRIGFNAGVFDAFNIGEAATAPIISIAEGGSGSDWLPAFAAVDSTATLGSVGAGALLPGQSATAMFTVDSTINQFFTFGTMVVPSNDFFLGNDNPMQYRLFDDDGNLLVNTIDQTASQIWNAGSEAFDPLNAAFLSVGTNASRTPENGVVEFNFAELTGFNGLETAAGYDFQSGLLADTSVYRITFSATSPVPEPATWAIMLLGLGGIGLSLLERPNSRQAVTPFQQIA